jgi:hypothetical protein
LLLAPIRRRAGCFHCGEFDDRYPIATSPPQESNSKAAQLALNFVINYEEGSEQA